MAEEPTRLDISDEMIAERRGGSAKMPDDMPKWMALSITKIDSVQGTFFIYQSDPHILRGKSINYYEGMINCILRISICNVFFLYTGHGF